VPTADFLDDRTTPVKAEASPADDVSESGSLGIGNLRQASR
jgi:hypothetical protein